MLIRIENGFPIENPVDEYNFRALFPAVSFPRYLSSDDVEPYGFGFYEYSQTPSLAKYQKAVEGTPVRKEDKVWYQNWEVVDMDASEKLAADKEKEHSVRNFRNYKLSLCDWTQLPDSPADHETWATYRQELRDVTAQPGFPWDVVWPEAP